MGKYFWKNGDSYEGNWKNDLRDGKGVFIWSDGDKYDGEWKKDMKEGNCVYYDNNEKKSFKEIWKNNEFVQQVS
jgi:hypothetical protein